MHCAALICGLILAITIPVQAGQITRAEKPFEQWTFAPEPTPKAQKTIRLDTQTFRKPNLQYCSVASKSDRVNARYRESKA